MSDHDEVNDDASAAQAEDTGEESAREESAVEEAAGAESTGEEAADVSGITAAPPALAAEAREAAATSDVVTADVVAAGTGATAAATLTRTAEEDEERAAVAYGWTYLAVLGVIFGAIAFLAYSCDSDDPESTMPPSSATTVPAVGDDSAAASPVALAFTVAVGTVTLTGAVPDEGARRQLVDIATARYGDGNVVDQLTIDEATTLTGGTITTSGAATEGDANPEGLQADVVAALGLTDAGVNVSFEAAPLTPVDAEAALAAGKAVLSGELPDQASIDAVVAAAVGVWGDGNVDGAGLTVGDVTWAEGQIRVSGTVDAGDTRGDAFAAALAEASGGATIDLAELTVDSGAEALARSEEQLRAALEANPILFALGSAEIDPASDEILTQAAAAINAAPDVNVEIVGHTDNLGGDAVNERLSASRADAVLARLIELGVDETRLTSRGAGAAEPVADNDTDEGRAKNRRIAFEFEGAE